MKWEFRVTDKEDAVFFDAMKKLGLNKTQLIKKAVLHYIGMKRTSKGNIKRLFQQIKSRNKVREHNSAMYLIKNCQRTVYNLGVASLFNIGELNFKMLNKTVDNYVELYDTFTKDEQELLKKDIEGLKLYKNKRFLAKKFKTFERLDFIKKEKKNG